MFIRRNAQLRSVSLNHVPNAQLRRMARQQCMIRMHTMGLNAQLRSMSSCQGNMYSNKSAIAQDVTEEIVLPNNIINA